MLDIWPDLPLIIHLADRSFYPMRGKTWETKRSVDNIVAALKRSDRVCRIDLTIPKTRDFETYLTAMQRPFPKLTYLDLWCNDTIKETVVARNRFLGGFAPYLEVVKLRRLPFPGLPKLLLSATHLVHLRLSDIPHSGYFSPDAMAAALSTLTSLGRLTLEFKSPESSPDLETRRLPPSTRSVLPVLTFFSFQGVSEYLEDLVTDIDFPQLNKLWITFFNDSVFDTPQLIRLISRTPMSSALEVAQIVLRSCTARISFRPQIRGHVELMVSILCEGLDWQLSFLEQISTSCLPFLSTLKDLYIHETTHSQEYWKGKIENRVWLELLHPFTAVKNIYISKTIPLRIGPALQELIGGRSTALLPTLENIFLAGLESSGDVHKGIGQFVAARQVSSHPVTISRCGNAELNSDSDIEYYSDDESYSGSEEVLGMR